MRSITALAMLTLACGGATPAPRTPCPVSPPADCPACPAATCPSLPDPSPPPSPYSDTTGWFCTDDPAEGKRKRDYSYCWSKREDCEQARDILRTKRPAMKPCRPHAPAYCYDKYSSLLQHRRFACTATMEQCVDHRAGWAKDVLPEEGYVFSPCTEQP